MTDSRTLRRIVAVIVMCAAVSTAVETSFTADQITGTLQKLRSYDYPADPGVLGDVEDIVRFVIDKPDLRRLTEQRMVELLESDATSRAKQFICQQLWIIGGDGSVKALEAMLLDSKTSEIACFALRTNPSPAAGQALRRSLDKSDDTTKVRIIDALGRRRDVSAIFQLIPLLGHANADIARAAAVSLGDMGGDRSTRAIIEARETASGSMRAVLTRSLLRCAEYYTRTGRPEVALKVYARLSAPSEPVAVRRAAAVSALNTGDPRAVEMLAEAVKQNNAQIRAAAIANSHLLEGPQAAAVLIDSMETADADTQMLIVEALGRRDFQAVRDAVVAAAGSPSPQVRIAACNVLAGSGEASSAGLLCDALDDNPTDAELETVLACLRRISGKDVDKTIFQAIEGANAEARRHLISVVGDRGYRVVVPSLCEYARKGDAETAGTALRAVEKLGGCQTVGRLIDIMLQRKEADVRDAAAAAIIASARRSNYVEPTGKMILKRLAESDSVADRCSLMRILTMSPGEGTLSYLQDAVKDDNTEVRDCAVRTLARYPESTAAETLLEIFETTDLAGHRMVALQGCIRLCRTTDMEAGRAALLYGRAMRNAESTAEKRLVLSGLPTAAHPEALQTAVEAMEDARVKAEASQAIIALARELAASNPRQASEAAAMVLRDSSLKSLHPQAQAVIEQAKQK